MVEKRVSKGIDPFFVGELLKLGQQVEVVRDNEAFEPDALTDGQHDIARPGRHPRNIVL
jgi:hypothetical protein